MVGSRQPWIHSAGLDTAFVLSPAFMAAAVVLVFGAYFSADASVSVVQWVFLVLLIDVAHVYSTLYRTYLDPEEFQSRRSLYLALPFVSWVGGVFLYKMGPLFFWKALAYLAVFHFVRQQYGFMMIYGRKEFVSKWSKRLDKAAIYSSTIYPLVYWHTHQPRNFSWFIEGDFFTFNSPFIHWAALSFYVLIMVAYFIKEARLSFRSKAVNVPRNLLLLGTAISWYVGIVHFNSDLAFTATNVVAHGIPYMALVWVFERKKADRYPDKNWTIPVPRQKFFSWKLLPFYLGLLVLLAYVEEGIWDGLIWREHLSVFPFFNALPRLEDSATLTWLIPLLALPQATHYLLDGFIWKMKDRDSEWTKIAFGSESIDGEEALGESPRKAYAH